MLKQLSIFAENIKGKMQKVTGILLEEDINILGSVTNDSAEYGIIRMVVSKPEQALEALTKAGFICKLSDVLGIEVKDENMICENAITAQLMLCRTDPHSSTYNRLTY